jgi:hypothetical protein
MTHITQTLSISPIKASQVHDPEAAVKAEFGRLIHAAVINRRFRQKLLSNPLSCIEDGYCNESFHFSTELKERIQHIHAESLESLSLQLLQTINSPRVTERVAYHYQ